jgi:hypothetical protein
MTDDGSGLQKDNPILGRDVVGMQPNIVTGNLSLEDAHLSTSFQIELAA